MKTGTKHQNKNNRGKGGRETEEKEKSSKYKENQRRENMLEGRKKAVYSCHNRWNSTNQDSHLNQGCLRSIKI